MFFEELQSFIKKNEDKKILFLCIGTDKCLGDTIGPLVGTFLEENNSKFDIIGTLDNPVHALNLNEVREEISLNYKDHIIIAVDTVLGPIEAVGSCMFSESSLNPGSVFDKKLGAIGHAKIIGVIAEYSSFPNINEYVITTTRLSKPYKLAKMISNTILKIEKDL